MAPTPQTMEMITSLDIQGLSMGTREVPKEYFNIGGTSVTLIGDTRKAREFLPEVKKMMFQLHLMNTGGLEQDWLTRQLPGGGYAQVNTRFGIDVAYVYIPPRHVFKQRGKRIVEIPTIRYVPAFHTVDANGIFVGLTICTSGKWGPPYLFVSCSEDDILNFDDGQWNVFGGNYPPDPGTYQEKFITGATYADFVEEFFDLPAAHRYAPGAWDFQTGSGYTNQYTADEQWNVLT